MARYSPATKECCYYWGEGGPRLSLIKYVCGARGSNDGNMSRLVPGGKSATLPPILSSHADIANGFVNIILRKLIHSLFFRIYKPDIVFLVLSTFLTGVLIFRAC